MRSRGFVAALAMAALVAGGCAGSTDAGLLQDGPVLRTIAADGTLVVEGRAFNLSDRPLEGAQVVVTIRRDARPSMVVTAPLGEAGHVGAFETVAFRVETGIRVATSAQMSIGSPPRDS
ncbi:MAG: hypothetical protein IPK07_21625 [Deltaproteobacteria bacterium]|nr:hypothetical protein [Deltaproteobacteria bacterium]